MDSFAHEGADAEGRIPLDDIREGQTFKGRVVAQMLYHGVQVRCRRRGSVGGSGQPARGSVGGAPGAAAAGWPRAGCSCLAAWCEHQAVRRRPPIFLLARWTLAPSLMRC